MISYLFIAKWCGFEYEFWRDEKSQEIRETYRGQRRNFCQVKVHKCMNKRSKIPKVLFANAWISKLKLLLMIYNANKDFLSSICSDFVNKKYNGNQQATAFILYSA